MAKVTAQEIRAAASFLRKRKKTPPIQPGKFARAAKEQGRSFSDLLAFIMRMFQGQTNQAAQRREQVRAATGSDR
jgi:hypothetical protein